MSLPPGPAEHPWIQLGRWMRQPLRLLDSCRARHGEAFTIRLAQFGTVVFFSAPGAIRQVFTLDDAMLDSQESVNVLTALVGERSLLALDGREHHRHRKLMLPPFHGARMQAYATIMRDLSDDSLDGWPVNRPFSLLGYLQDITIGVIVRTVFGVHDGARMAELKRLLGTLVGRAQTPWVLIRPLRISAAGLTPWDRFLSLRERADRLIHAEIGRRRAARDSAAREDVLSLLLEARDDSGAGLTDTELRDELMTLLFAGHETSAATLAWAFERLLNLPDVLRRVVDELASVVGDGPLEPAHVARLTYLDGVVRETLRLRPIILMNVRTLGRPAEIAGHELPAGTKAAPCIYLAHLRGEAFPDPTRFDPTRWFEGKPGAYEYLPFGGGSRRCLGNFFALYEMKIVLATLLLRARLRLASPGDARWVRRGLAMVPENGTQVLLAHRRARPRPRPAVRPRAEGSASDGR